MNIFRMSLYEEKKGLIKDAPTAELNRNNLQYFETLLQSSVVEKYNINGNYIQLYTKNLK